MHMFSEVTQHTSPSSNLMEVRTALLMNASFTISMIQVQFRSSAPLALRVPEEENSSVDVDITYSFMLIPIIRIRVQW